MTAATLATTNVSWAPRRFDEPILHHTSFAIQAGRVLGVLGPNGAGKSSLLRLLYRFTKPSTGRIEVNGLDLWKMTARDAARMIAAVLQEQPTDFALTVREIVALGRTPHRKGFGGAPGARDAEIVDSALARMDLGGFAQRSLSTLSGGERQRVMVARALAQEPRILILDEPTNHLDIRHQLEILALIRDLPLTIVTSLHDLNMAATLCDEVLLLKGGRTLGFGPPEEVLSETAVSEAFHVHARRDHLSMSNTPYLTFHLPNNRTQR